LGRTPEGCQILRCKFTLTWRLAPIGVRSWLMTFSGGLRGLRPPVTFSQPFRLLSSVNYMNAFASLG